MTHPAISAAYSKRLRASTLMIAFVALLGYSGVVEGQGVGPASDAYESEKGFFEGILGARVRANNPEGGRGTDLPIALEMVSPQSAGEDAFTENVPNPEEVLRGGGVSNSTGGGVPDHGMNVSEEPLLTFGPLRGFQQLARSDLYKQMFQNLVTADVPVLFQTYMMVENGAATGYIGGLNAISNMYGNTMQAGQLNLDLMDISDPEGRKSMKRAFVRKMSEALTQQGNSQDFWPGALYQALGDELQQGGQGTQQLNLNPNNDQFDLRSLPGNSSGSGGGPGASNGSMRLFSDLLFQADESTGGTSSTGTDLRTNESLEQIKEEVKKFLGDFAIEVQPGQVRSSRKLLVRFIPPSKQDTGSRGSDPRRGWSRQFHKELSVVWEHANYILSQGCEFRKDGRFNEQRRNGEKTVFCTDESIGKVGNYNLWRGVNAPDFRVTCNLFQQLMNMVEAAAPLAITDCASLRLKADEMPKVSDGGGSSSGSDLNNCGKNRACARNLLILNMSEIVARSRTLQIYRSLYSISMRFASDPQKRKLVDELFAQALSGMNLEEETRVNRERWLALVRYLSQYSQGQSGGSGGLGMGPANSITNFSPGSAGGGRS